MTDAREVVELGSQIVSQLDLPRAGPNPGGLRRHHERSIPDPSALADGSAGPYQAYPGSRGVDAQCCRASVGSMAEHTASASSAPDRPLGATHPWKLGWRQWTQVAKRTKNEFQRDNLSLVAAGAAFFAFLSIFPALVALIAIYGLLTDPAQVESQLSGFTDILPQSAAALLQSQMERIASGAPNTLGSSAIIGILVAIWSSNKGMRGVVQAINIAYDQEEKRGFVKLNSLTLGMTIGGVITVAVLIALIAVAPIVAGYVGLGQTLDQIIDWVRWPVLALILAGVIAILYRLSPSRPSPSWRWLTPGSVLATVLFLVVSALFSLYVSRFGSYGETYGSVGAVAILMLWLYLGALSILLGAEINAEAERQAGRRVGSKPPLGTEPEHAGRTSGRVGEPSTA